MAQEYISQVSEGIEGRVTKKLSKDFSWTEARVLGALSKLDDILLNPQVRTCSVAVPRTSRNSNSENREPIGDGSLDDPCPEAKFSSPYFGNLKNPKGEDYPHMVTGVPEEICDQPHMVTRIKEEIPYSSSGISSGKQKKVRSTSQPQFRCENTLASIEADQILLAPQQLATNSNSVNFNNNINRISKLSISLTTIMPTFDKKIRENQTV